NQRQPDAEQGVGSAEHDGIEQMLEELVHVPLTGLDAAGARGLLRAGLEPPGRPRRLVTTSGVRKDDLAVLDLDEIDARIARAAFRTRGAGFLEFDLSVHAGQLDLPERRADRLGLRLARLGDRGRDGADAVIAAEALGQTRERIAALLPFVDEGLG